MNFRVRFLLDGSGVYFDPNEPIHLDALLCWTLAPHQGQRALTRDDVPGLVSLPLKKKHYGQRWVWRASALFPEGKTGESLQFWRKRFRQNRAELSAGSPNLTNGTYRDWNMPMPLMLTRSMIAYASGDRRECRKLLKDIRYLGKKRAHGLGKVVNIELDETDDDWSLEKDGHAMRWLPDENGTRLVRLCPPYWHPHDRMKCCEVGTELPEPELESDPF